MVEDYGVYLKIGELNLIEPKNATAFELFKQGMLMWHDRCIDDVACVLMMWHDKNNDVAWKKLSESQRNWLLQLVGWNMGCDQVVKIRSKWMNMQAVPTRQEDG